MIERKSKIALFAVSYSIFLPGFFLSRSFSLSLSGRDIASPPGSEAARAFSFFDSIPFFPRWLRSLFSPLFPFFFGILQAKMLHHFLQDQKQRKLEVIVYVHSSHLPLPLRYSALFVILVLHFLCSLLSLSVPFLSSGRNVAELAGPEAAEAGGDCSQAEGTRRTIGSSGE